MFQCPDVQGAVRLFLVANQKSIVSPSPHPNPFSQLEENYWLERRYQVLSITQYKNS
jgi:hypothetical protein